MSKYDYVIVGAGLYGVVFAQQAKLKGKTCLVIDKRSHIGGNVYCENIEQINVHKYGAHIFHTNDKEVWNYVNSFVEFNRYTNSPVANFEGELYNLPFNMNTFYQLWGVKTPQEARNKIDEQCMEFADKVPANLEEQALKLVGKDIYYKLIKGYTEKQWGRDAKDLPSFIIKRLPVRFTFDNNYFNDKYQGIPIGGYNVLVERLLDGVELKLNSDFFQNKTEYTKLANKIVYTGMLDEFFDYCYGELEYRSLHFEHQLLNQDNYQGNAVVNYTERNIPYTRIIEHKHFDFGNQEKTVITREYPQEWDKTKEAYYPINNDRNNKLFATYKQLASQQNNVIFGGRLGDYAYYDMDKVIRLAIDRFALEKK
ncbi:MAG: UDP-galactopyranose mutase [Paludibacteraceae bacterium]|nr:UDP-galactopyranose mutase [Paludibacteraceae bacterium]